MPLCQLFPQPLFLSLAVTAATALKRGWVPSCREVFFSSPPLSTGAGFTGKGPHTCLEMPTQHLHRFAEVQLLVQFKDIGVPFHTVLRDLTPPPKVCHGATQQLSSSSVLRTSWDTVDFGPGHPISSPIFCFSRSEGWHSDIHCCHGPS